MKPESALDSLAIPPALLADVKAAAERAQRPVADVLREVVEQGLAERRQWQAHAERERDHARAFGIHEPADDLPMTDAYRQTMREKIAQGLQSLREGKGTEAGSFFAEIYAELDELAQQGRE
jgi:hypothetical protein